MGIINWPWSSSGASFSTGRYESSIQWNQTHNLSGLPSRAVAHYRTFIILYYVGPSKILYVARLQWTVMCLSVQELVSSVFSVHLIRWHYCGLCSELPMSSSLSLCWRWLQQKGPLRLSNVSALKLIQKGQWWYQMVKLQCEIYIYILYTYYGADWLAFTKLGIYVILLGISKITMVL